MIRITVTRAPGGKPGPDIIDALLCTVPAALARGTAEIDREYISRDALAILCPGLVAVEQGDLVFIGEGDRSYMAMVRTWEVNVERTDDAPKFDTTLTVEKLADE